MIDYSTLHELQKAACQTFSSNPLFGTFDSGIGDFQYLSYDDFEKEVHRCRSVLRNIGVGEFDKVAIISNNRWEWATIATAAFSINATIVPMYEAQLSSDWAYILNDSRSCAVVCASQNIFDRLQKEVLPSTPSVHAVLCLDAPKGKPYAFSTAMSAVGDGDLAEKLIRAPTPEDLADLIYTSGTTGKPKGVELTHGNFTSNIMAASRMAEDPRELMTERDRSLAFLPWAHSYGQTCELWMGMSLGASIGICRGIPSILEDLQLVKPTILFSVPTLYKKVYDGVHNMIETQSPMRAQLLRKALEVGRANADAKYGVRGPLGFIEKVQFNIFDNLVLSKIRDKFGGRMRYGCVAAAACPLEVHHFMDSLGIPLCEGYGLTETSPIITINVPGKRSLGSVGRGLDNVSVYIVDEDGKILPPGEEGEICCVGPNVMRGYHNNPEATAEVISRAPDGISRMFHTGDLGRLDENGWLRVTGRIKEQYKLDNGKYIVPTPIETAISASRFISQVVLYGANQPFNIALIVPDWDAIRNELSISGNTTEEELANDERVKTLIDMEIVRNCHKLKKFEIPTKWTFVAPFTLANNMLTPKMSIRRHKVVEAYEDVIAHLYGDDHIQSQVEEPHPREEAA